MVGRRDGARVLSTAALSALVALCGTDARAQPLSVTAGINVRLLSGTFGSDQTTTLVYVPASLRVEAGRLETSFYFPYLRIADGTVAPSQGGFVPMQGSLSDAPGAGMPMGVAGAGTAQGGMMSGGTMMSGPTGSAGVDAGSASAGGVPPPLLLTNQAGLGDLVGSVGYRIVDSPLSGVQVVVGTRFKIPTASSTQGLGTGKFDIGALAGIRKQFDRGWAHAEGGYLRVGKPTGVDLQNAVFWSVGAGRPLSGRTSLLLSAAGNTAILQEFGAPLEVGAGVGIRAGERLVLTILPSVGLSEASPRIAVTFGLGQRLLER